MKIDYVNKIKEEYSNKTKDQLQVIIIKAEKELELLKLVGPYFTVVGFSISAITLMISQFFNKHEFLKLISIFVLLCLLMMIIVLILVLLIGIGRISIFKKTAEFELINRKDESEFLKLRNKNREDRLKEKYLSKR